MKKLKIVAVCGFGLGSSMLLKMKIDEVLKKHGLNDHIETTDISSAPSVMCDLIFTSYELGEQLQHRVSVPVVMVKSFLDTSEIEKVGLPAIQAAREKGHT